MCRIKNTSWVHDIFWKNKPHVLVKEKQWCHLLLKSIIFYFYEYSLKMITGERQSMRNYAVKAFHVWLELLCYLIVGGFLRGVKEIWRRFWDVRAKMGLTGSGNANHPSEKVMNGGEESDKHRSFHPCSWRHDSGNSVNYGSSWHQVYISWIDCCEMLYLDMALKNTHQLRSFL